MNKFRFWFALVLLVHILISSISPSKESTDSGNQEKEQKEKDDNEGGSSDFNEFIDKPSNEKISKIKIKFEEVGEDKQEETEKEIEPETSQEDCGGFFYYGIGVSLFLSNVEKVAKGYAADRAGIQVGDKIIGYVDHKDGVFRYGSDFKEKSDSKIDITVIRNGKEIIFTMVREKICYNI